MDQIPIQIIKSDSSDGAPTIIFTRQRNSKLKLGPDFFKFWIPPQLPILAILARVSVSDGDAPRCISSLMPCFPPRQKGMRSDDLH